MSQPEFKLCIHRDLQRLTESDPRHMVDWAVHVNETVSEG